MNKNFFNEMFKKHEMEIIELYYSVSCGKIESYSYPKNIKWVDDEHFSISDYHNHSISYKDIQKWRMNSWSSNSYSYRIYLLKDESIDNYIVEINEKILKGLNKEISELKESIEAINQTRNKVIKE